MGLLDKLWDDTLAGPQPDAGLGKLRKSGSITAVRSTHPPPMMMTVDIPITTTVPSPNDSVPSSPAAAGSITPGSPFTPGWMRFGGRRKSSGGGEAFEKAEPRSPTVYDWVVISALDR